MREQRAGSWPITDDLPAQREQVHRHAARAGLRGQRLDDLVLAFSEAASNVLEHAHGRGSVTVWHSLTDVVVEVTDHLGRLSPGHRPRPPLHARSGYGLWLMGRLCDELVIAQGVGRSSVRLRMRTGDDADLRR
ncbi:ATP-binding protein [Nonomuraea recticatena]